MKVLIRIAVLAYPRQYRRERAAELIDVATQRHGSRLLLEAWSLVRGGFRQRGRVLAEALRHPSVLATLFVLAGLGAFLGSAVVRKIDRAQAGILCNGLVPADFPHITARDTNCFHVYYTDASTTDWIVGLALGAVLAIALGGAILTQVRRRRGTSV
jgi:hypothetical protein